MKKLRRYERIQFGKRLLAMLLVVSLTLGLIPQSAYATGVVDTQTEVSEEQDVLSDYGLVAQRNSIQLYCNESYFNCNLYTGKDFTCSGTSVTVDGRIEAVGDIHAWCGEFAPGESVEGAETIELPELRSGIESKSDVWEEQESYMNINGEEVCNGFKESASGIQISGTHFTGDCYLLAEDTIQYSVDSLNREGGRIVLYSENGDINISGSDIVINGILAAPNGTVRINANNVTINGRIYAANMEMSGTTFNMHASEEDLELIRDEADIVKIYDKAEDFEEGNVTGIAVGEEHLTLDKMTYPMESQVKEYNQDGTGIEATVTMNQNHLTQGENKVHYNVKLKGNIARILADKNVDAYFRSFNGHLYAFIQKSLHWNNAKTFCEEAGGHLVTVSSEEEMNMLKELAAGKGGYVAIGFTDAGDEGNWRWVTGEEVTYTNWNYGEPNNSFGSGQDQAYMYGDGTWDDGYNYTMSPFICEWEMEDGPIPPTGRNLEMVIEVNGKVEENGDFACLEHADGTTTVVYFAETVMPAEEISLDMDIAVNGEEGYQSLIRDSYYIYYDSQGKSHRIEMGDTWVPVKQYTESGSWKTVYDSERNGTKWGKLLWDVTQSGDSSVKAYVCAYDSEEDKGEKTEITNGELFEDIKGRYIEVELVLLQGQDYRTPVVDQVVLFSKKASEDIAIEDSIPIGELACAQTITAGSVRSAYYKLSGGLEQVSADVQWTLTAEKGEMATEDYSLTVLAPYLVQYQIHKEGTYALTATTDYQGQEIVASQRIVVRKAPEMKDIESLTDNQEILLVLDMPDYGKPGETITGNLYMPGGEIIEAIRVLQDGEEIVTETATSFQAVLPESEGKVTFDIYLTFVEEREVYKQHVVYVDNQPPVVQITPEKERYTNGESGTFFLTIEDDSPMKSIAVTYDGMELLYEGHNEIRVSQLMEGEHTITVIVTDIAGNQTEEIYRFVVAGEHTTEEEIPDKEFAIRLNRKSASVGGSIGVQMLLPVGINAATLQVLTGTDVVTLVEGKGNYIPKEPGTYTFIATAQDAEGNVYRAEAVCQVYDTSDQTPPDITITVPEQDAVLTDVTDIVGSVSDNKALDYYTIEYAMEGSDDYTLLVKDTEPKENETLGTLDTTMLLNGRSAVKLTAWDKGGNSKSIEMHVMVEGDLKVGAMHIGFTDITANMGRTTVSVNRVYDSRNKSQGDFGYGWSLGMQGITLSESGSITEGYEMVKSGSVFSTGYQMTETMNHDVVVAYGDGTSDRFELTFTPERQALVPISEVKIGYRCVTNQKVKLEIVGDTSAYVSGTELVFYEESMYDALNYKLTTEEGNEIYLNCKNGVYKIVDSVGNVITVDEEGYHSADGKSIAFTRDDKGRIVKATDPTGKDITYEYDEAGDLVSVTDTASRTVTFTYDKKHNLMSITDPMGIAVARNEYDDEGRLIATIDADGNRVEYDYDIEGRTQAVKDRRGNTTVYTYDDNGNILRTVDAYGNKTDNTYDKYNNLLTTTDAKGNTTSYAYDASGNVTQVTAPDGTKVESTYTQENYVSGIQMMDKTVMAMEYDDKGRLTSVEDANGNVTKYDYTSDGKLTSLTDEIGTYQKVTYDDKGNVATTANGAGESASYTYDEDGRCTSVTVSREENGETLTFTSYYSYNAAGDITQSIDNAGNVTKYEYDANGNQTASTDAKGRRIGYTYDDLGNMTKVTYPDGTFETFTYDANGNNITATDRNGLTVTMSYDKLDRMTEKKYADGAKESYAYDEVGNVTEQVSTSGAKTRYGYDSRNRNTSITDTYGKVTTFEYDEAARLTKRIDSLGNAISYEYDDNGNITKTTYADGNSVTSEYDARNRVTRQEDQYGNETTYEYDGADRLTKVTDVYDNSYSYGYDANGNLVTVTDANEHVTRYSYDDVGRVATVTNALGKTMSYSYDETGNVTEFKDYAGTVTTYSYDDMNRLVEKKVGSEKTIYNYDDKGQLIKVTDKSGDISYGYDKYGRLTSQTNAMGVVISYNYDKAGRLETFDNGFGTTTYEYDLLDRVTRVIDRNGKATVYEYDELGNRSAVRYPNGNLVTYTYDACQRLKEEWIVNESGVTLAKYTYGLGKAGERTSITEVVNGTETEITYKYDKLNRLIKETIARDDNSITNEFEYDVVSNRISKETTVKGDVSVLADVGDEEIKVTEGTTTYTYNALNQLVTELSEEGTITYTFDDNGNLVKQTGDKTVDYSYDKENHLLRATIRKGNSVTIESYTYDYAGNRTSKTINETDTTYYVNDTSGSLTMVVAETDKAGKEIAYYTRGDELLSMENGNEIWYYLYDGHGSVRILTNEAGRVTDRYAYDAYGNLLEKEGDSKNEFLYTGEQYNANTGLYYLRARYMSPSTGTFICMDSYQGSIYDPVTLHKYLYAGANPVTYVDPSGYSFSKQEMDVAIAGDSILAVGYAWNESVMFRMGMNWLAQAYKVHGQAVIRILYTTAIATLLLNPESMRAIDRWANCFNLYAANDAISEIPDDVESASSEESVDTGETSEDGEKTEHDKEKGALDQLGKDLENAYRRNGSKISEEEARIIDELCQEFGKGQHHDTDYYKEHPHWEGPHTHIGNRHIPFQ